MFHENLPWHGPFQLDLFDFAQVPAKPGVYAFTESCMPLAPNPPRLGSDDMNYESRMELLRSMLCVLYVGKATTLSTRLRGYRFRPYLEIKRRSGPPSRHEADPHQGRALLHAQQYFDRPVFLWWAETFMPEVVETELIRELHPVLNTLGIEIHHSDGV